MNMTVTKWPYVNTVNHYYGFNRAPLQSAHLLKLPLGSIQPQGWLRHQLELMKEGMTGQIRQVSHFVDDRNGWLNGPEEGWEEQPYWLRGYYSLAVALKDGEMEREAFRWIEAVISSQQEDGYFGPVKCKLITSKNGRTACDLWPHMVMIDALIRHYEYTADQRVISLLSRFFSYCSRIPDESFLAEMDEDYGDWKPRVQRDRAGDMMPHIYWLYNKTGEEGLLALAARFYSRILPPQSEILDEHVVNFTQRFAYPGIFYTQTGEQWHLDTTEYWYAQHLLTWGFQPGGVFGADENTQTGFTDPRQGFETCAMVEFAKNFYSLGRLTGDPKYADRCEEVMLNHFPASMTPDLKGLHYLTASNQPQLDKSEAHAYNNPGIQIAYSPGEKYRCCQHNVAMGWPWYCENLYQATPDNGLAIWMYLSSSVSAFVGNEGKEMTLKVESDYPFNGNMQITIAGTETSTFPLYLRIPKWCRQATLGKNGNFMGEWDAAGEYIRIEDTFSPGDCFSLVLAMDVVAERWPKNGSVSIRRGPLYYSLKIEEEWKEFEKNVQWPEWEVFPVSEWNYGLLQNQKVELAEMRAIADQPWTVENAPVYLSALGRMIPQWNLEKETISELRMSPIHADTAQTALTLIPMGCARLRISCFPVISDSMYAKDWDHAMRCVRRKESTASHT